MLTSRMLGSGAAGAATAAALRRARALPAGLERARAAPATAFGRRPPAACFPGDFRAELLFAAISDLLAWAECRRRGGGARRTYGLPAAAGTIASRARIVPSALTGWGLAIA